MLMRRAVIALRKRRALARLAFSRRRSAARDAAVESSCFDLLLDEGRRSGHAFLHGPGTFDSDIDLRSKTTGVLVQNNILERGHASLMLEWDAAGNVIAYNRNIGVGVGNLITGVPAIEDSILGNSIFANGQLGIDLAPGTGVTPNDPGDADTGPNNLQNFPVLEKASTKQVHGRLNSQPGGTYRIEVFANTNCDQSGYGEGARFIGALTVTTNPQGDAQFKLKFSAAVSAGQFITATATDAAGNTSEFSACTVAGKDDPAAAGD